MNIQTKNQRWLRLLRGSGFLLLSPFIFLTYAAALQLNVPPPAPGAPIASTLSTASESLRPALAQVGSALNQVHIDHWKISHDWKGQLHDDVNSIQQDLTSQLPSLYLTAQQSPMALEPQLSVIHNVDALYDVLVRIATAASIAGGKEDAAILDNAVQQLETARKAASAQLLQAATVQDQQIAQFKARLQAEKVVPTSEAQHPRTIVVDNRVTHHTRHHKPTHRKPSPSTAASPGNTTPAPATPTHN